MPAGARVHPQAAGSSCFSLLPLCTYGSRVRPGPGCSSDFGTRRALEGAEHRDMVAEAAVPGSQEGPLPGRGPGTSSGASQHSELLQQP